VVGRGKFLRVWFKGIWITVLLALPTLSAAQDADIILKRGHLLYQHDQAAWHGTDSFLAAIPEGYDRSAIVGYVVTSGALTEAVADTQVSFFAETPAGMRVIWNGIVRDSETIEEEWLAVPRPLNSRENAKRIALKTALPAVTDTCDRRMNTVVLDGTETGRNDLLVYYLTPMHSLEEAVFGRHYRANVSLDGEELLGSHSFTNSCAIFPARTEKGPVVSIFTTHLRDDYPQETHVFVSLTHNLDVAVGISKLNENYWVNGDEIRRIEAGDIP
jgi:hypothetical protein